MSLELKRQWTTLFDIIMYRLGITPNEGVRLPKEEFATYAYKFNNFIWPLDRILSDYEKNSYIFLMDFIKYLIRRFDVDLDNMTASTFISLLYWTYNFDLKRFSKLSSMYKEEYNEWKSKTTKL